VWTWNVFANPFATAAAMIAFLGMTGHNPFSVVRAPQEIPVGPPTEYNSTYLSLLQTNRSIFNAAKLVLYMNLFFGGATNLLVMVIKTFLIYLVNVVVGAGFPRFKVEQSIRFFLVVPTILGLIGLAWVAW
jgi:NADH-quinone oxidoreductase subunit H